MIVFDSSTLILISKIDILKLFVLNFHRKILIPVKVSIELRKTKKDELYLIEELIRDKKITILKVKDHKLIYKLMEDFNIDAGEAEALSLAIQENVKVIATDDRNAIKACKMLNMEFITAIAILLRAVEKKLIPADEALLKLEKLESIGRYSKTIIDNAYKAIKEAHNGH